jgi:hypothetical protein
MIRLGSRVALSLLLATATAIVAPPASSAAGFGVAPGSFIAKTHAPVPLLVSEGETASRERQADLPALAAAPPVTQAGAHPDATASLRFDAGPNGAPLDNVKDVRVDLPAGFIGDPTAVPACPRDAFVATYRDSVAAEPLTDGCPVPSQVGVATLTLNNGLPFKATEPVYRIATAAGSPASFAIPALGFGILLDPDLRSAEDYGVSITASDVNASGYSLLGSTVTLWGVPADPVHDPERIDLEAEGWAWGERSQAQALPFISNPSACDQGPLTTRLLVDSWQQAGRFLPADPADPTYNAPAPEPTGCAALRFGGPSAPVGLTFQPTVHTADTPSGYQVHLALPYNRNPAGLASPILRDTTVSLPEGVVADAASATGLAACSEAEIGYLGSGFAPPAPIRFDESPPACPGASKIGTVSVETPLLEAPLEGDVYLARQSANPFGSLLAIYLAIDDPATGTVVKLAGKVTPDPGTGQLTATFTDNPQLPFTALDLRIFGGPGAPLANPTTCGTKSTASTLAPWSSPATPPVGASDSFGIDSAPAGSGCPGSEAQMPFAPDFEAGTTVPLAAAYSPFVLRLDRGDGTQRLGGVEARLPAGLLARLAGVERCGEAAIAAAKARSAPGEGALEAASPSCPAGSRVGPVRVAAGAGPSPVSVVGAAYLAGPYEGAPLSLAIVTPALAGPFDLGTVVVRVALHVDQTSAQVSAISDPLPQILDGIPLDLRSVAVELDRPRFTVNPTGCSQKQIAARVSSDLGAATDLTAPFAVAGCGDLGFAPKLSLRTIGKTHRGARPRLRAELRSAPGEANIARAQVNLPHSLFLEQGNVGADCTRVQFASGPGHGAGCPSRSVYGWARAFTPLLDSPLEGPVYLRASSHKLPDLVAALHGEFDITLDARVDSGPNHGLRTTFEGLPDAPVERFVLSMKGGRKGLLVISEDLCAKSLKTRRAVARLTAQDGSVETLHPAVAARCKGDGRHRRPHRRP